jgi:hypothetical protein
MRGEIAGDDVRNAWEVEKLGHLHSSASFSVDMGSLVLRVLFAGCIVSTGGVLGERMRLSLVQSLYR